MATNKRVNILVYSGSGATPTSLRHALHTLRRLLSPNYAVLTISANTLLKEPWQLTCAALVFPGGADLPYCKALDGLGNSKIKQFVQSGGKYIGFCAGGYYGSSRCEFMVGHPQMEVVGDRELAFYPGICRGLAFKGFKYQSEAGARAAELVVSPAAFDGPGSSDKFRSYFNGGGVFVDAETYKDKGVEVLASYTEPLNVDSGKGTAAVVYCKVGEGASLLTAPHPEFAAVNLDKDANGPSFAAAVEALEQDDKTRVSFLKACLAKLGLEVNQSDQPVPSLSPLHLSSQHPSMIVDLLSEWREILSTSSDGSSLIEGENDTFVVENLPSSMTSASSLAAGVSSLKLSEPMDAETSPSSDKIVDYEKVQKHLVIHPESYPPPKDTPSFNHHAFFANRSTKSEFGKILMYGEVVNSTSTLLDKNIKLLRTLPTGFTVTATTQVSGRGRGSNVWVSPPGSLMFSTVIWHPATLAHSSPVIFVQYLAAMAVIQGVQTYAPGYSKIPVRLKWPNDVYAEDPTKEGSFVKIGGILVNSTYSGETYGLVVGIGVNVANRAPTTGLDALAGKAGLKPFQIEKLLARILNSLEGLYQRFISEGWGSQMEDVYYKSWLHSNQIVTVETEGGMRAKIKGLTRDWGLLLAEELGWEDRPTGYMIALQSDSNSFDFFRGLIKKKL